MPEFFEDASMGDSECVIVDFEYFDLISWRMQGWHFLVLKKIVKSSYFCSNNNFYSLTDFEYEGRSVSSVVEF